jgi:hypothetical protein
MMCAYAHLQRSTFCLISAGSGGRPKSKPATNPERTPFQLAAAGDRANDRRYRQAPVGPSHAAIGHHRRETAASAVDHYQVGVHGSPAPSADTRREQAAMPDTCHASARTATAATVA